MLAEIFPISLLTILHIICSGQIPISNRNTKKNARKSGPEEVKEIQIQPNMRESTFEGYVCYSNERICDIEECRITRCAGESHQLRQKAAGHDGLFSYTTQLLPSEVEPSHCEEDRLMYILRQASIAEHIHTVQSFYKDRNDDLKLAVSAFISKCFSPLHPCSPTYSVHSITCAS